MQMAWARAGPAPVSEHAPYADTQSWISLLSRPPGVCQSSARHSKTVSLICWHTCCDAPTPSHLAGMCQARIGGRTVCSTSRARAMRLFAMTRPSTQSSGEGVSYHLALPAGLPTRGLGEGVASELTAPPNHALV